MHRPPVLLRAAYLKNLDLSGGGGCSLLPVKPVIPTASSPNGTSQKAMPRDGPGDSHF